jgi:hypothetical protein
LHPASDVDPEFDAHFFAVALKNLRSAVEWGRDYCNGVRDGDRGRALGDALATFDDTAPHVADVRDVRNVQEHFVDYE